MGKVYFYRIDMKDKDILQKIIANKGSCNWADPSVCAECPIGKLTKREDNNYLSCADALKVDGLTEEAQDAKYKYVAERLLLDLSVDEILTE